MEKQETSLLRRAKAGERAAFSRLVGIHHRRVYACALQMLKRPSEAEDAVQETFMRAWRGIARFDGRSELSTWLYRICVNVSLNHIRKRKRHAAADIDEVPGREPAADPKSLHVDPGFTLESGEFRTALAEAIESLSPSLRTTVQMVLIQGLPQKQVATSLGCSEGTIAWRVHESRRRLREALGEWFDSTEAGTKATGSVA